MLHLRNNIFMPESYWKSLIVVPLCPRTTILTKDSLLQSGRRATSGTRRTAGWPGWTPRATGPTHPAAATPAHRAPRPRRPPAASPPRSPGTAPTTCRGKTSGKVWTRTCYIIFLPILDVLYLESGWVNYAGKRVDVMYFIGFAKIFLATNNISVLFRLIDVLFSTVLQVSKTNLWFLSILGVARSDKLIYYIQIPKYSNPTEKYLKISIFNILKSIHWVNTIHITDNLFCGLLAFDL